MANRTAWTAGNGAGLTWTTAINQADLAALANGSTVLSSVADIANGTGLDIYADIAARFTVTSATPPAGAYFGIYLAALLDDGATYGDGFLTSGGRRGPSPDLLRTIGLGVVRRATSVAVTSRVGPPIRQARRRWQ
jgi:hypothetical protein